MRVISGDKKGLKLTSIKNSNIRPTTDAIKEVIFNVIKGCIANRVILDVFAGSGSLGIEALSRGAARAVFIEKDSLALSILFKNLQKTNFTEKSEVIKISAKNALKKLATLDRKFDLIFADPPYKEILAQETVVSIEMLNLLSDNGWLIVEHSFKANLPDDTGRLKLKIRKRQGESEVSFFRYA